MLVKIITGVILAAVALAGILYAPFLVVATVAALVFLAAQDEFVRLSAARAKTVDRILSFVAGAGLMAAALSAPEARVFPCMTMAFGLGVIALLLGVLLSPHPMEQAGTRAGHAVAGLAYVGLLSAIAILSLRDERGEAGRAVVLMAGVVTWGNDTMAYFGGKAFGRHRMYPAVSPNKTWEGSVSGMIGSVAGALIVRALLLPDAPVLPVVGFALAGGALGQTGDLVESVFKRACGVKDSAGILPGHGGFLDRVDAFLFVAPVAYFWFFQWFPIAV